MSKLFCGAMFWAVLCAGTAFLGGCATTTLPQTSPPPNTQGSSGDADVGSTSGQVPGSGQDPENSSNDSRSPNLNPGSNSNLGSNPAQPDGDSVSSVPPKSTGPDVQDMPFWSESNPGPALAAFKKSCTAILKKSASSPLSARRPEYGTVRDWTPVCRAAFKTRGGIRASRSFFQNYFKPVNIATKDAQTGLLTGYYQPELSVRRRASAEFSEPILTLPKNPQSRNLPRKDIMMTASDIIAFGRPADVFFMQVQGSGVLRFPDGKRIAAGYGGNNGYPYSSIGRVLVQRGEMTVAQASKERIEQWMAAAGPAQTRALMNENARYIFFDPKPSDPTQGPVGAMGVNLTAKGSVAIDPVFYPYGVPVWIAVKTPTRAGDYTGRMSGHLLITQDTGSAIKGPMRGDIYFGSGDEAGQIAGVMKHRGRWTVLLPTVLAERLSPRS